MVCTGTCPVFSQELALDLSILEIGNLAETAHLILGHKRRASVQALMMKTGVLLRTGPFLCNLSKIKILENCLEL